MFLLHVSPPRLQFLPGANDRPSLPLMPHASCGVATHEIVKPRGFAAPLLDIIKGLLRMMPDSGLVRVRSTQCNEMQFVGNGMPVEEARARAFWPTARASRGGAAFKKQTEFWF